MTKIEFEAEVAKMLRTGETAPEVSDQKYKIIEKVYNFHPSISETKGREQIANLYINYGITIFMDMVPRAALMESKERQLLSIKESLRKVQNEIEDIRNGRMC